MPRIVVGSLAVGGEDAILIGDNWSDSLCKLSATISFNDWSSSFEIHSLEPPG